MEKKRIGIGAFSILVLCTLFFIPALVRAQQIEKSEAVDIAVLWYVMEYNSGYNYRAVEKGLGLEDVKVVGVSYLLEDDEVVDSAIEQSVEVYAYIVEFAPFGWICISSQEIANPIIAFNVEDIFSWRDPSKDGIASLISETANAWVQRSHDLYAQGIDADVHRNLIHYRDIISGSYDPKEITHASISDDSRTGEDEGQSPRSATYARWKTADWDQWNPYNDVINEIYGLGNPAYQIPAGCSALTCAVKMRFHKWPLRGNGSETYVEYVGSVGWETLSAEFNHYYDWDAMPLDDVFPGNDHVENLMYEVGVAIKNNYELDDTSAIARKIGKHMRDHFKYNKGEYEFSYNTSNHLSHVRTSIHAGALPMVANKGHRMLATGYRSGNDEYLYVNSNGQQSWCHLDGLPHSDGGSGIRRSLTYQHPKSHEYVKSTATYPYSGWLKNPYRNLSQVLGDLYDEPGPDGARSHLWIKAGDYMSSDNAVTIDKYTDIRGYYGEVNVRNRLIINSDADNDTLDTVSLIRISEGGSLEIK